MEELQYHVPQTVLTASQRDWGSKATSASRINSISLQTSRSPLPHLWYRLSRSK